MENSNGIGTGQDGMSSPGLAPSSVSSSPETSSSPEVASERVFKQSEVSAMIGRAKQEAVERERRRTLPQDYSQPRQADSFNEASQPQMNQNAYQANNTSNEERIRQIVAEETRRQQESYNADMQKRQQEDAVKRIVGSYQTKIAAGKTKYQDFDTVTGDMEIGSYPYMVETLADYVDNAADVLYEFGKDRMKLFQLEQMLQNPNTRQEGMRQTQRFAQSIKDRSVASKIRMPNEPLSQLQSSSYGIGNDGDMPSVKDLRAIFRM